MGVKTRPRDLDAQIDGFELRRQRCASDGYLQPSRAASLTRAAVNQIEGGGSQGHALTQNLIFAFDDAAHALAAVRELGRATAWILWRLRAGRRAPTPIRVPVGEVIGREAPERGPHGITRRERGALGGRHAEGGRIIGAGRGVDVELRLSAADAFDADDAAVLLGDPPGALGIEASHGHRFTVRKPQEIFDVDRHGLAEGDRLVFCPFHGE